jgi:hypothetical protein
MQTNNIEKVPFNRIGKLSKHFDLNLQGHEQASGVS